MQAALAPQRRPALSPDECGHQEALSRRQCHRPWASAEAQHYGHGLWATYRQWQSLGAQVRKGEKAAPIVFYKVLDKGEDEQAEEREGQAASLPRPRMCSTSPRSRVLKCPMPPPPRTSTPSPAPTPSWRNRRRHPHPG
jgi:hypothetical protein